MKDYIVRVTAAEGTVRGFAAVTTELVDKASRIHDLSPIAASALGRTLTAAGMMSRMLKNDKDKLQTSGQNARKMFEDLYRRQICTEMYYKMIVDVIND